MKKYKHRYVAVLAGTFLVSQLASAYPVTGAGTAASPAASNPPAASNASQEGPSTPSQTAQPSAPTTPSQPSNPSQPTTPPGGESAGGQTITEITGSAVLGSIPMGRGVTAKLEDVKHWQQEDGTILTYTVNYVNSGSATRNLIEYFSRVTTAGGAVISANPISQDAAKKKIPAGGNIRVTYYVNLGKASTLKGVKIGMLIWDVKTAGYLKRVGTYAIPASYSETIPYGKSRTVRINGIPVAYKTESLQIFKANGKTYAKAGVAMTNLGNKAIGSPGYAVSLLSPSGSIFDMALDGSSAGYRIQPSEKKTVMFITEVPGYMKLDNMRLAFTRTDGGLNLELPVASFKLPGATTYNPVVEKGTIKKITISQNTVETQLASASVSAEDGKGLWTFQFRFRNKGNKTVTIPAYEYSVRTTKGSFFPAANASGANISLKPTESKLITLTAQVPLEFTQNQLQLQVLEPAGETDTARFPLGWYKVQYTPKTDSLRGLEYRTTNEYGTFAYSLESLQRLPWLNEDVVVAKLLLTNMGTESLSLPNLKAAMKLDKNDLTASTELMMDKSSAVLATGKSAEIYVLAKVPYTENFGSVKVILYPITSEGGESKPAAVPLLTLTTDSSTNSIPVIAKGQPYNITVKGKNAEVKENRTIVYEAEGYNVLYTEMLMKNKESRQSKMA